MSSATSIELEAVTELLLVDIGSLVVAVPIESVREVIEFSPITLVPMCPSEISGVINVRGSVVPVIDAAKRLHVERTQAYDKYSCIILYESRDTESGTYITIGLAVSRVRSIKATVDQQRLEKPPFGTHIPSHFIEHMVEIEGEPIPVLVMTELLNSKALNSELLRFQSELLSNWEL